MAVALEQGFDALDKIVEYFQRVSRENPNRMFYYKWGDFTICYPVPCDELHRYGHSPAEYTVSGHRRCEDPLTKKRTLYYISTFYQEEDESLVEGLTDLGFVTAEKRWFAAKDIRRKWRTNKLAAELKKSVRRYRKTIKKL
jgi:hypothetical protein